MRKLALRAEAADIVDAGGRGPSDFRESEFVESRGWARRRVDPAILRGSLVRSDVVDVEVIKLAGRAIAPERAGIDLTVQSR